MPPVVAIRRLEIAQRVGALATCCCQLFVVGDQRACGRFTVAGRACELLAQVVRISDSFDRARLVPHLLGARGQLVEASARLLASLHEHTELFA